jgi:hypothetical protein
MNKIGFFFVFTNPRPTSQAWAVGRKLMTLYMTMQVQVIHCSIPSCYPCLPSITLQKSSTKDKKEEKKKRKKIKRVLQRISVNPTVSICYRI